MQGLGNDFIVIDNIEGNVCLSTEEIRQLSDRRFGIGFDQLLMVESANTRDVDFRYVIFNADGSEVSQCGNGARCFALYLQKKELTNKNTITVETNSGNMVLTINRDKSVRVEMGKPNFIPSEIPFITQAQAIEYSLESQKMGVLSIGNPHAIIILKDINGENRISKDEVFGPVASIIPFDSQEDAIKIANDTVYGLAASVWSDDLSEAHYVSDKVHAGTISVNAMDALSPMTPFGGFKQSGFGKDLSIHSFDKYTGLKTVWIKY